MITFQMFLIVLFSIILLILISRLFFKRKFYITSCYDFEKEYHIDEVVLKQTISGTLKQSNFKNIKENENRFTAITLPSMSSFSELICVDIITINETKCIVKFNSTCLIPTTIIDWGKNRRNSNSFFKNLEKLYSK
ncbi:MAG: hypothetical protein C0412_10025 [Flavobacterium sp.]|nr:hypothetical protein [Flavobacterium sp.]